MNDSPSVNTSTTEVAIIGAGILGLFNALQLAKRGLQVTLIDNIVDQKRSYKVGESLLIFSNPFLRTIAELDDFVHNSYPKDGVWFSYGAEGATSFDDTTEWAFQTKLPQRWHDAMPNKKLFRSLFYDAQIVRPEAEDLMRETVRAHADITFLDSATVKDVVIKDEGSLHEVRWHSKHLNETGTVHAPWVVDCSGRNRFLAKKLNHAVEEVEINDGFQTTAVWAQFDGITDDLFGASWAYDYRDGGSTLRDRNTCHLWGDGYWIWVIRLSNNRISIGATFDQQKAPPGKNYKEQFWHLINRYPLLSRALLEEHMLELRIYRNVQYMTDTFVSERRYGMVGDASSIIDAYYSQGISLSLVTSWHIANIIQKDLREGQLDHGYITHVNRATRKDWHMMRNMVKEKYTTAIADPRFFILSHLLDITVFSAVIIPRFKLVRWLVETSGDLANEKTVHRRMRKYLAHRLYLSQTPPWSWLSPETVERVHHHLHAGIGQRARWRLEHDIHLPRVKSVVRVTAPMPRLWALPFARKHDVVDISPTEIVEPAWMRITGKETRPLAMAFGGPSLLVLFLLAYCYDWIHTSLLRFQLLFRPSRRAQRRSSPRTETGRSVQLATMAVTTEDELVRQGR